MENIFLVKYYLNTFYGIFHAFYMFGILAKPVKRGKQIEEL